MSLFPRYAIYYVPDAASELYRYGASLLGYDAFTGGPLDQPAIDGIAHWPALTAEPRKYGFHATLKAPMALAQDQQEADLIDAFDSFAATPRDIPVIAPVVTLMGDFVAIIPGTPPQELSNLADACVTHFDRFRAPLSDSERARRLNPSLTPRQTAHVERWGYPYVFEDFRFHMTLTGRVPSDQSAIVLAALRAQFDRLAVTQIAVDVIGLFRQASADRNFEVIAHRPLRPAS